MHDNVRFEGPGEPDAELLSRFVLHRDEPAFDEIVRRHGPMVLAVCRRSLGNGPDADDAFQATFLVLAMRAASIRNKQTLAAWLWSVARQTATSMKATELRRRTRELRFAETSAMRPEAPQDDPELKAILEAEVDRLAPKHRTPVVMCYLEGKTNREAAHLLGLPDGTLATRLREARELLRRRLARKGVGSSSDAVGVRLSHSLAPAVVPTSLANFAVQAASGATSAGASLQTVVIAKKVAAIMAYNKAKMLSAGALVVLLLGGGTALILQKVIAASPSQPAGSQLPLAQPPAASAPATQKAGVDPKADEVLDKSIAELAAMRSYAMHVDYNMSRPHQDSHYPPLGWISSMDVRVDGSKFDQIDQTWDTRPGKKEPETQYKSRTIWDGHRRIHRQQYQGPGPQQIQPSVTSTPLDIRLISVEFLFGIAWGDQAPMAQVVRESGVARLRPRQEDVAGYACQVIDAKTVRGAYTLWLDPDAGYQIRRALVVRKPGDLWFDKPLASEGTDFTTTGIELNVQDIQIDKIDGHFVSIQGSLEKKWFFGSGGKFDSYREVAKRSNLQFNPDFQRLGAFVMDGIPDGTRISNMDRDGPLAGLTLVWRHGDVVIAGKYPVPPSPPSHQPAVGELAPRIVGTDMDGKPLDLNNYRGKVVVLVFWGTWCGPSMSMVPHERALTQWLKGKPFALLGVDSDDNRDQAEAVMRKEQITWSSWFDGGTKGPVARKWDVHSWPSVFVIDAKGAIRYKDVRGDELEQAVIALLKEVQ